MRIFRQKEQLGKGFERPQDMPEALYRLLVRRGIASVEEARAFLRPEVNMLNDPHLLPGVTQAVSIIKKAVHEKKKICVYGDYDVDGVSASAIMTLCLRRMGADMDVYLPSRHEEGYGLNENAVREVAEKYDLMITVDCGITSVELIELAKQLGLQTIVTDHHRPAETLPDTTVINPLVGDYPEHYLCGGGVAFKLCEALIGREAALDYVDIAALATVADLVTLTGENRVITKLGLDSMNKSPRPGIAALRDVAGMGDKPFNSGMLGFQIGPRLNASGRLGSARRAYELLISETPSKAREIANELNAENELRRQIETEISTAAMKQLEDFDFIKHRAIVVAGEGWNSGVIGLAASRIVEMYHYPTILISLNGDVGVGSCRSIEGVDIHKALTAVGHRMVKFGGHSQAAGLTINRCELDAFIEELDDYLRENIPSETYIPVSEYDTDIAFNEMDTRFVALMEAFAPTGMGNPAPLFHSKVRVSEGKKMGRDSAHLSLRVTDGTTYVRGVAWREGNRLDELANEIEAVFVPKINEFNGRTNVEIEFKTIESVPGADMLSGGEKNELLASFLTQVLYNRPNTSVSGKCIGIDELNEYLASNVQGNLIIAADRKSAEGIKNCDIFTGRYPADRRAFNALCIMPEGDIPEVYKNVFFLGMPAPDGCIEVSSPRAEWTKLMPGIDELRIAYIAVKKLLSAGFEADSLTGYAVAAAAASGMNTVCLTACIIIFIEMKLVVKSGIFRLEMGEFRKLDPESSAAYRAAQILKEV